MKICQRATVCFSGGRSNYCIVENFFYRCIDKTKEIRTTLFIRYASVNITRITSRIFVHINYEHFPQQFSLIGSDWPQKELLGAVRLNSHNYWRNCSCCYNTTPRTVSGKGGAILEARELGEGGGTVSLPPLLPLKKQTILPLAFMNVILMFENPFATVNPLIPLTSASILSLETSGLESRRIQVFKCRKTQHFWDVSCPERNKWNMLGPKEINTKYNTV